MTCDYCGNPIGLKPKYGGCDCATPEKREIRIEETKKRVLTLEEESEALRTITRQQAQTIELLRAQKIRHEIELRRLREKNQ